MKGDLLAAEEARAAMAIELTGMMVQITENETSVVVFDQADADQETQKKHFLGEEAIENRSRPR